MKKNLVIFLFSVCVLFLNSCFTDPCENISCLYGDCVNGTCDCVEGYEGADCSDEKTPDAIRISNITLTKFPNYDNGGTWDLGSGPDVYVKVLDQSNGVLYNSSLYYEDAESGRYYSFDCSINLTNLSERNGFVVYDYDVLDADDYMGGVETNVWQTAKGNGFPSNIRVDYGDFSFELTLGYVFN